MYRPLLYLDNVRIMHSIYQVTRYYSGHIVKSASMEDEICRFEASLKSHFWAPQYVIDDKELSGTEFQMY